ncbi:MAG TPA: hypothetical protein VKW08_19840 [Xanthobacteraceae bacterium]|nr:hypothetical protein [Xanthobacteraceae bacterium]
MTNHAVSPEDALFAGDPADDLAAENASPQGALQTIAFRCPPELDALLPRPIPAVSGIPDWFKKMPAKSFSDVVQAEQMTVKKCPPFIDAMTFGFLIPLVADLAVEDGVFTWQLDFPSGAIAGYPRSPLDFHDNSQVVGTPLFEDDSFILKFNNFWKIETPPGYSLLVTHPVNRFDLPFTTLTGLVDTDLYKDSFINFPARWRDGAFRGILPKGTPVAQCLPVRRDLWRAEFATTAGDAMSQLQETSAAKPDEPGLYRRQFRAPKR